MSIRISKLALLGTAAASLAAGAFGSYALALTGMIGSRVGAAGLAQSAYEGAVRVYPMTVRLSGHDPPGHWAYAASRLASANHDGPAAVSDGLLAAQLLERELAEMRDERAKTKQRDDLETVLQIVLLFRNDALARVWLAQLQLSHSPVEALATLAPMVGGRGRLRCAR